MSGYRVVCIDRRGGTEKRFDVWNAEDPKTFWLTAMKLEQKKKSAGKFTFTFLPQHPHAEALSAMGTDYMVMSGEDILFCGRPLNNKTDDIYNPMSVTCEGNLNWLADVLDSFSTPAAVKWDYKVGGHSAAVIIYKELQFDEIVETDDEGNDVYTGVYRHIWEPGDYEEHIIGATEEGREFEVTVGLPELADDGEGGKVIVEGSYVNTVTTLPYERYSRRDRYGNEIIYGFLGNVGYFDDTLELRTTKGGSAKFVTSSFDPPDSDGEMRVEAKEHSEAGYTSLTVRICIRARRKLPVQQMFGYLFRAPADAAVNGIADYNLYCSSSRRMYRGACDIDGETVYDAKKGGTVLDTLNAWQKEFGGYLYTTWENGKWLINYTKDSGVTDETVRFAYGENLINVQKKTDVSKALTVLVAVGVDDQTGDTFTTGVVSDPDFPASGGFVVNNAVASVLGVIMARREYKIAHQAGTAGEAAMKQALYDAAVTDLIEAAKNAESVSVTAVDPRLMGMSLSSVRVGNRYPVESEPNGISYTGADCLPLNSMVLDLLEPENSKLEFGEERPLLINRVVSR